MSMHHRGIFVAHAPVDSGERFSPNERRQLLMEPGIGPTTVERLERAGYRSIESLRRAGANHIVAVIAQAADAPGWANRRRAIERAIFREGG